MADDETPHADAFRQALAEEGIDLSREDDDGRFLGGEERACTRALLEEWGGPRQTAQAERGLSRKAALYATATASTRPPLFPGVVAFIKAARASYPLAIAPPPHTL